MIGEHLLKRTKESCYSGLYKITNEKVQSTVVNTEAVLFVMLVKVVYLFYIFFDYSTFNSIPLPNISPLTFKVNPCVFFGTSNTMFPSEFSLGLRTPNLNVAVFAALSTN